MKEARRAKVQIPETLLQRIPAEKREALIGVLAEDPRPSYHEDPVRVYGFEFAGFEVRFRVEDGTAIVEDVILPAK